MSARNDAIIYSLGSVLAKVIPLLTIPYLTNKLGVEKYGELSISISWAALILCFTLFSLDSACVRYYYRYGKRNGNEIITISIVASSMIFVSLFLVTYLYGSDESLTIATLLAFNQSIFTITASKLNFSKNAKGFISIQMLNAILAFSLTLIFFELKEVSVNERLYAIFVAYWISSLVCYFLFGFNQNKRRLFRLFKPFLIYSFSFGLPLLIHNISFVLKGNFDRVVINGAFSSIELGFYALGAQLASIFGVLILSINKALVPHVYEKIKNGTLESHMLVKYSMVFYPISIFIFLISMLVPSSFFEYAFGEGFAASSYYFSMFTFSVFLSVPYLVVVNYLFYHGMTKVIAKLNIVSTLVYLILVWVFSNIGMKYIPIASIISSVILSMLVISKVYRYGDIKIQS
ncbi:oligosaccharide flippase family protein [Enterovibrio sp. ZSDZ42]|uniref:Oligosaccharide flippase family protein n=1 Tax=Enterovibrio gelatinilyticus TaxID=2899819 RepID=A0ABT5R6Z5_9GAMM|nr:oligosaccharide flippase family protein [Enterovibrio sp. ZSDZ42]MDD1796038.1 oligosaccharide flippase family protein [Enterovibrio sp. ZSDZ42]